MKFDLWKQPMTKLVKRFSATETSPAVKKLLSIQ